MPPGPLPTGTAVRRNKPTIPTTSLPATGRTTPIPEPPAVYAFGPKGSDWWGWAWRTPQACAWDDGALFMVARRAQLEDDMAVLESGDDLSDFLGFDRDEMVKQIEFMMRTLKALAGGRLAVAREMRELDDRLGLTPKGLAALRWKIVPGEEAATEETPKATRGARRLKAV